MLKLCCLSCKSIKETNKYKKILVISWHKYFLILKYFAPSGSPAPEVLFIYIFHYPAPIQLNAMVNFTKNFMESDTIVH